MNEKLLKAIIQKVVKSKVRLECFVCQSEYSKKRYLARKESA